MREPLVQTQVMPYLREIQKDGIETWLLTFEPAPEDAETRRRGDAEIRKELAAEGIRWSWLRYHKRPSAIATAYDILRGTIRIRSLLRRENFDVLHCRVHVPGLMGALARKLSTQNPKLLFDIRGFVPEEYTDAGVWKENGLLYRAAKRVERWLMRESDGFVVLTEKAKEVLFHDAEESAGGGWRYKGRPVEVIPCCVDLASRFAGNNGTLRSETRKQLGIEDRFVITHLGALGGLYLSEQIADLLAAARESDPKVFGLFLTQSSPAKITALLRDRGFMEYDFLVTQVPPAEVPKFLAASDAALSFVKATFATLSRSPTKIPEYLACGLPIVANPGVGDVDKLVQANGIGVLIEDFSRESHIEAIIKVKELGDIGDRCREAARREFDLETVGGARYRRIYRKLLQR